MFNVRVSVLKYRTYDNQIKYFLHLAKVDSADMTMQVSKVRALNIIHSLGLSPIENPKGVCVLAIYTDQH